MVTSSLSPPANEEANEAPPDDNGGDLVVSPHGLSLHSHEDL